MVGKLIFAIVYLLIGRFVVALSKEDSDEAMRMTIIAIWPTLVCAVIVYAILRFLLWLIGGGERNG